MSNMDIYRAALVEGLGLEAGEVQDAVRGETVKWDSIGHMSLIAIVEEEFGVELEPEDILGFQSYQSGIEILSKHGIEIQ